MWQHCAWLAHSVGKVYVSAPTQVAVDNFAKRIDALDQRTVARHNRSLTGIDQQFPIRRKLIIRGFPIQDEIEAFGNLLHRPTTTDAAPLRDQFRGVTAKCTLHLSPTYWLLKALGSPDVSALNEEDNGDIQIIHGVLEKHLIFATLVAVARGKLSWAGFQCHESNNNDKLIGLFELLIERADLIYTTPEMSEKCPYQKWKTDNLRQGYLC